MIAQGRIAVKVADTDVAVTGLAGLPVLVNLAHETGLMDALVRSDSAWYQRDVLDHAEEHGYGLAVTADKDEAVLQTLASVQEEDWRLLRVEPDPGDSEPYVRAWACPAYRQRPSPARLPVNGRRQGRGARVQPPCETLPATAVRLSDRPSHRLDAFPGSTTP